MATNKDAPTPGATWPLGEFLRDARGTMSIREAARRAGISESRWRQVEAGYQQMAGGIRVPVQPRAETIAAMTRAISADVRQGLELAGHKPAQYEWLLAEPETSSDQDYSWFTAMSREERETALAELQRLHLETELAQRKPSGRRAG